MDRKNVKPSGIETLKRTSPQVLKDSEGNTETFEEAAARAEKLGALVEQVAQESIRVSQEAINRVEKISKRAKEAAEAAARASQEAVRRAESNKIG